VPRGQRLVGLLTLVVLIAIAVGISGLQLSLPRFGGASSEAPALPGVRALDTSVLLRVGIGAPAGGELAFLAVEPSGNLMVSDSKRHSILRFDATGHLLSEWGPRLGDTTLGEPAGVAVQGDTFYVVDRGTPRIFRLDTSGRVLATVDVAPFGPYGLNGLAVDLAGNMYVADTGRNRILVFGPNGAMLKTIGRSGADLGGFTQPMMLAFAADGGLFVADWENSRIEHWNAVGQATDAWSIGFHPFGVDVDQAGRVYVPDTEQHRVEVYTGQGALLGDLGGPGSPALDVVPRQVAVARSGQLALYALGSDGIVRLDLENTPPPPQGGPEVDVFSLAVIAVLAALLAAAVASRRARRIASSAGPSPGRPVRLHTENGAQHQHEQTHADQDLLIADQAKRKH
jgi:DNA-binding beta-propeller fold protein YncE